jgi:hypothetical protein
MYVIGFIGNDSTLGRTLGAETEEEVQEALKILLEEHRDEDKFEKILTDLENNCVAVVDSGTYFCGIIEDIAELE